MKLRRIKLAAVSTLLTAAVALAGCSKQVEGQEAAKSEQKAKAADLQVATAAYRCPMGCEGSASSKPGKCPVCEMELERNPNYKPAADSL